MELYESFNNFIFLFICYHLKLGQIQISFSLIRHYWLIGCFQSTDTRSCRVSFSETDKWNTPYYQQLPDVWVKIWLSLFHSFQETIRWIHDAVQLLPLTRASFAFSAVAEYSALLFSISILHRLTYLFISLRKIVGILHCKSSPKYLINSSGELSRLF